MSAPVAGGDEQSSNAPASSVSTPSLPHALSPLDLEILSMSGNLIIPNFLPQDMIDELRRDVDALQSDSSLFRRARIGQDGTNELNMNVRVAETCFLGRNRSELTSLQYAGGSNSMRDRTGGLYDILDGLRISLDSVGTRRLDNSLTELLSRCRA